MAEITRDDVLDYLENANMLEVSELIDAIEEKFGVSAQAPVAMAAGAGAPATAEEVEEEKDVFDVILSEAGSQKIQVIKVVRSLTNLGLKEAKDLVDNAPNPVKEQIAKEEAEDIKSQLEEVGATVELK